MNDLDLIAHLTPQQTVGLTIYGEARNQPFAGRQAIAAVIANRVAAKRVAWGLTPEAVCRAPWQFSCWRIEGGAANYGVVLDAARLLVRGEPPGPILRGCLDLGAQTIAGVIPDIVLGATHYLAASLFASNPPSWAKGLTPVCQIGSHVFFRGVS